MRPRVRLAPLAFGCLLAWAASLPAAAQHPGPGPAATGHGSGGDRPAWRGSGPAMRRSGRAVPPVTGVRPVSDLAAGAIRVLILDGQYRRAPGTAVQLIVKKSEGRPSKRRGTTDAEGLCAFSGLQTGDEPSYRVKVSFQGATYSAGPFHLPVDKGIQVMILRADTTRDGGAITVASGEAVLKLVGNRVRAWFGLRLNNAGARTYLFPQRGLLVPLPAGHARFQSPEAEGDARVARSARGELAIFGSLPPGRSYLSWQYDLPIAGDALELATRFPWPILSFRVAAEAYGEMRLDVQGMAVPQESEQEGQRFLVAQVRRGPFDPQLKEIAIAISGIPGPGASRWVALALSLLAVVAGLFAAFFLKAKPG